MSMPHVTQIRFHDRPHFPVRIQYTQLDFPLAGSQSVMFHISDDGKEAVLEMDIHSCGWVKFTSNIQFVAETKSLSFTNCMNRFRLSNLRDGLPVNLPSTAKAEDVFPLKGMENNWYNLYVHIPGYSEGNGTDAWIVQKLQENGSYRYLDPNNVVLSLW